MWRAHYHPRIREKVTVAYRYLFFLRGSRRQRNLLKTTKRSLKSFNNSIVIGANIIMILLTIVYLYRNSIKAFFTKIFMIKNVVIKRTGSLSFICKYWLICISVCCAFNLSAMTNKRIELQAKTGQEPIKKIVKEMAKYNVYVFADGIDESGKFPDQESRYRELVKIAGADDLIALASKDKNPVVRLYAYKAIVRQFSKIPADLFEQFSNDKSMVKTLRGKVEEKTTVDKIAGTLLY